MADSFESSSFGKRPFLAGHGPEFEPIPAETIEAARKIMGRLDEIDDAQAVIAAAVELDIPVEALRAQLDADVEPANRQWERESYEHIPETQHQVRLPLPVTLTAIDEATLRGIPFESYMEG